MNRMVIAFFPDGSVEHTLKDTFFNPLPEARREVERMSHVTFCEPDQKFYIIIPTKRITEVGNIITYGLHISYPEPFVECGMDWHMHDADEHVLFDTYEEAVAFEIAYFNEVRLRGLKVA